MSPFAPAPHAEACRHDTPGRSARQPAGAEPKTPARFRVERADPLRHGRSMDSLLRRRYAWRGLVPTDSGPRRNRIALVATADEGILGTVTLGLDGPEGLLADPLYPDELARLRGRGARLCELSRLAIDTSRHSQAVLAGLIHQAYIHAHLVHRASDAVVEVHPRHAAFYRRMLGFRVLGDERLCPRVGAPAVLLHLDLQHMGEQIARHGGTAGSTTRSLYPLFFSPEEQAERLRVICPVC